MTDQGHVVTLPAPLVPGLGGQRVLRDRVAMLLSRLGSDRLEVHDQSTLHWIGAWADRLGIPSIMVSHVFRPSPNAAPPLVGVRYGCVLLAYREAW